MLLLPSKGKKSVHTVADLDRNLVSDGDTWSVAMSHRDCRECGLLLSAMRHPDHCIAFQRKCCGEASLKKIEFIHQSSGGLQTHFTLGCSEKKPLCKAR